MKETRGRNMKERHGAIHTYYDKLGYTHRVKKPRGEQRR